MRRREFLQGLGAAVLGLLLPKGKAEAPNIVPGPGAASYPHHRILDNPGITWLLRDEFDDAPDWTTWDWVEDIPLWHWDGSMIVPPQATSNDIYSNPAFEAGTDGWDDWAGRNA